MRILSYILPLFILTYLLSSGCAEKEVIPTDEDRQRTLEKRMGKNCTSIISRVDSGVASIDDYLDLGLCYCFGLGITENKNKAAKLFEKAKDQKDTITYFLLGVMYLSGEGVLQDYHKALKYFRVASHYGVDLGLYTNNRGEAEFNIGWIYAEGKGVPQDLINAYAWYNISASKDNRQAAEARIIIPRRFIKGPGTL